MPALHLGVEGDLLTNGRTPVTHGMLVIARPCHQVSPLPLSLACDEPVLENPIVGATCVQLDIRHFRPFLIHLARSVALN